MLRILSYFLTGFLLILITGCAEREEYKANRRPQSPITVRATENKGFATFTHADHRDNHIGYRFFEHTPLVFGPVPVIKEKTDPGLANDSIRNLLEDFSRHSGVLIYREEIEKDAHWVKQQWTFYLAPVSDGIDMLLAVQTYEEGLPAYYGVQQCFRMI